MQAPTYTEIQHHLLPKMFENIWLDNHHIMEPATFVSKLCCGNFRGAQSVFTSGSSPLVLRSRTSQCVIGQTKRLILILPYPQGLSFWFDRKLMQQKTEQLYPQCQFCGRENINISSIMRMINSKHYAKQLRSLVLVYKNKGFYGLYRCYKRVKLYLILCCESSCKALFKIVYQRQTQFYG